MQFSINFSDRSGNSIDISVDEKFDFKTNLLNNYIPPDAVIIYKNNTPISENHHPKPHNNYRIKLIDGYDIEDIRELYTGHEDTGIYFKKFLEFDSNGNFNLNTNNFSYNDLENYVEDTVFDTIENYDLIQKNDTILAPVTGGVDSSVQLILINKYQNKLDYEIEAITFGEPGLDDSPALNKADNLTSKYNIHHNFVSKSLIKNVFGLNQPLDSILTGLMETNDSQVAVLTESHVIRRCYEVFADRNNFEILSYGLHTSDILSGLIESYVTGGNLDQYIKKQLTNITYIYPMTFLLKKEIHLYYRSIMNEEPEYTPATVWKKDPQDRSFYAYLSNILQYYWPGIGHWLIDNHNSRINSMDTTYFSCDNCGAEILEQPNINQSERCLVCRVLSKHNYI